MSRFLIIKESLVYNDILERQHSLSNLKKVRKSVGAYFFFLLFDLAFAFRSLFGFEMSAFSGGC